MHLTRLITIVLVAMVSALTLAGCIRPYKIDIQQGNVLTAQQVQQVTPGMSRREVRYILGTPPVSDTFHANRWDYIYTHKPSKRAEVESRQFAVFFEDDAVASVEGDPSQLEGVEERYVLDGHVVDPTKTKKKGRISRLFDSEERATRKEAKKAEKAKKKAEKLAKKQKREATRKLKKEAAAAEKRAKQAE